MNVWEELLKATKGETKMSFSGKLKGGMSEMETKSRYEVIADLEAKKRNLIQEKANLGDVLKSKQKELREMKRELEDAEEEVKEFKDSIMEKEKTFNILIKSVEDSLERFGKLQEKQKK